MSYVGNLFALCKTQMRDAQFRELLGGAAVALVLKVMGVAAAFVFNLLLARRYGAGDVGLYFLAVSFLELLTTAGRLGLEQGAVALVGRHAANEEWPLVSGVVRKSVVLVAAASAVLAATLYLLAPALARYCFPIPSLDVFFRIIALAILPVALFNYLGEALKGLRRIRDSQFLTTSCHPILLMLGLFAIGHSAPIQAVAWLYAAAAGVTAGLAWHLWHSATPHLRGSKGSYPLPALLATSLPLFWVNILMILNSRAVTVILGLFGTAEDVGVLNIALRLSLLTNIAILAVGAISSPKFAALHGQQDIAGMAAVARKSTIMLMVSTLPLFAAMFLFPSWLMGLFGPSFAGHGSILAILALGQCFNIATGPVGALLAMTGRQHLLRNIFLATTPLHIVLQFLLTPFFQGTGAAWAITANTIAVNLAAAYVVRRVFGFNIFSTRPPASAGESTAR